MRNGKLRNDESELEMATRSVPRNEDNSDFYYSVAALIVLVVLTIIGFFIIGKYFMNNILILLIHFIYSFYYLGYFLYDYHINYNLFTHDNYYYGASLLCAFTWHFCDKVKEDFVVNKVLKLISRVVLIYGYIHYFGVKFPSFISNFDELSKTGYNSIFESTAYENRIAIQFGSNTEIENNYVKNSMLIYFIVLLFSTAYLEVIYFRDYKVLIFNNEGRVDTGQLGSIFTIGNLLVFSGFFYIIWTAYNNILFYELQFQFSIYYFFISLVNWVWVHTAFEHQHNH